MNSDLVLTPRELAKIFYIMRGKKFGLSDFAITKTIESCCVLSCFESLASSLREWEAEGFHVDVGNYYASLFEVFGKYTYPNHVIASCGLRIYTSYLQCHLPIEESPTSTERQEMRKTYVDELSKAHLISKEEVEVLFSEMLPVA